MNSLKTKFEKNSNQFVSLSQDLPETVALFLYF